MRTRLVSLAVTACACAAIASPALAAPPSSAAVPATGLLLHRAPDYAGLPALAVAHVFAAFDPSEQPPLPPALIDDLVHSELWARDVMRDALDGLLRVSYLAGEATDAIELAAGDAPTVPDLQILTTSPLAGMATSESSGFGWRDDPLNHSVRYHSGADFRSKPGTPVLAAGDGVVVFAAWQGGYGNVVYVDHGGGVVTRYAHLRRIVAKRDAVVVAGQQVGEVGATGRATGPHLHFEVRIDGHAVSPILAMSVAELQRTSPDDGRRAVLALAPALQDRAIADVDRPRSAPPVAGPAQRPDRANPVRHVKPLW